MLSQDWLSFAGAPLNFSKTGATVMETALTLDQFTDVLSTVPTVP